MTDPIKANEPQTSASSSAPQASDTTTGAHGLCATSPHKGDITSEHGDGAPTSSTRPAPEQQTSSGRIQTLAGISGPVGEPGLPPSRPISTATARSSQRGTLAQGGPSQRGAGPGSTNGGPSRPPTAASRTHVPSLTSHAFFRPMSSQRLQAQRGQRSSLIGKSSLYSDTGSDPNRHSNVSASTARGPSSVGLQQDLDGPPPPSRGTDTTDYRDMPDRTTANSTPTRGGTVRSRGASSVAPLHRPPDGKPSHLDIEKAQKYSGPGFSTPQRSPRSFRSSLLLPARRSDRGSGTIRQQGHEKLSSVESSPRLPPPLEETRAQVKKELGKNYEYFTGKTVFFWGGRLQNTRDRPINIITSLLVLVPAALFFAFSAPWLWLHISPAIPILFAYILLICMSSFFHASFTDPGILPRNLHPFPPPNENEDPLTLGPATTDWTLVASATLKNSAMEVPTKYCKSCNIWRPPRAHHCRVCDNCVETQDHHCVWLNNCVGRRNYRYFFSFVSSGTILGMFLFAASLAHVLVWMNRENTSFGRAIDHWRVPFAMVIYGVLVTPYPMALLGYHLLLMARGETTREYLNSHKFLKKDRHRPFTQGSIWKNLVVVLLRPRPPTYLRFKKAYEEGDQRFGERRGKRTAPLVPEQQGGGMEMQHVSRPGPTFQGASVRNPTNVTPRVDVPVANQT